MMHQAERWQVGPAICYTVPSHETDISRDLRLPDERAGLGTGGKPVAPFGVFVYSAARGSGRGALQHLQRAGAFGAKSVVAPRADARTEGGTPDAGRRGYRLHGGARRGGVDETHAARGFDVRAVGTRSIAGVVGKRI